MFNPHRIFCAAPAESEYNVRMPAYETSVDGQFHALHGVRLPDGSMEKPHVHDWKMTATFRAARLDASGFVIDFTAVLAALEAIAGELGSRNLNEAIPHGGEGVSAERVAEFAAVKLHQRLGRGVYCLRVTEAPGCSAAFYPQAPPA